MRECEEGQRLNKSEKENGSLLIEYGCATFSQEGNF